MKKYIAPVLSLFLITVCVVGLLAFTNHFTDRAIKAKERAEAEKAMSMVLPEGAPFMDITDDVQEMNISTKAKIKGVDKSEKGYVFTMIAKGYAGDIVVFVGINNEGKVENIMLGENAETPNLGKKAELPEFTSQFTGLTGEDNVPEKIDYITRATITTNGVITAVESALELYAEVTK